MLKKPKLKKNETENSTQKAKKLRNVIRSFGASPVLNVIALVVLLLSVFIGLRVLSGGQTPGAQIRFVEHGHDTAPDTATGAGRAFTAPEIFRGEVYDTCERLRETGALGMAISLAVFTLHAEQGSVPPNLEKIWAFLGKRNLMPPGFEFQNGGLLSPTGTVLVRYQSEPLRFEVLSRPRQAGQSPAILLRFPLTSLDRRTITYFQSASGNARDIPAAFAPLEKIVSAGWTIEQWRGELLPKNENDLQILEEEKRLLDQLRNQP
jgi:hypothetical protein